MFIQLTGNCFSWCSSLLTELMWLLDKSLTRLKLPFVLRAKGECYMSSVQSDQERVNAWETSISWVQRRDIHWGVHSSVHNQKSLSPEPMKSRARARWCQESVLRSQVGAMPGFHPQTPEVHAFIWGYLWSSGVKARKIELESLLFINLLNGLGRPSHCQISEASSITLILSSFTRQLSWQ